MKKLIFATVAPLVWAAIVLAQIAPDGATTTGQSAPPQGQPATATAAVSNGLATGTILSVELSKSLDARKLKVNDKIEAKTAIDILAHGQIVVPRNTKIFGHVTEAQARTRTSTESRLGITFDYLRLKDKREIRIQLVVQAVGRPLDVMQALGSGSDNLTDVSSRPGQLPPVGSQAPAEGSSSSTVTPRFPSNLPDPPSRSLGGSSGLNGTTVSPLGPTSRGVVGMKGLSLDTSGPVSVISSNTGNVHLDGGSQLILRVQ